MIDRADVDRAGLRAAADASGVHAPSHEPSHEPSSAAARARADARDGEAPPTASDSGVVAGWYGKLPTLGDFASRRLPAAFVSAWDDWLCARLAHSREALGEHWLDLYLTCPVWRFFAMPGALGANVAGCWTGVLMPSVDRVGRHFPLTIAAPLDDAPLRRAQVDALWEWLQAIERIALVTLECDHSIDALDAWLGRVRLGAMGLGFGLAACASGSRSAAAAPGSNPVSTATASTDAAVTTSATNAIVETTATATATTASSIPPLADASCAAPAAPLPALLHVPPGGSLGDTLADGFAPLWRALAHGVSLWSCVPLASAADMQPFAVLCTRGLPDDRMFVSMLTGAGP